MHLGMEWKIEKVTTQMSKGDAKGLEHGKAPISNGIFVGSRKSIGKEGLTIASTLVQMISKQGKMLEE